MGGSWRARRAHATPTTANSPQYSQSSITSAAAPDAHPNSACDACTARATPVMSRPSSFSALAKAIQSRRHVRNLKSAEKRYDISLEAYRSVRGFEAESRFTDEL